MTEVILNSGGMDSFFVASMKPGVQHVFVDIGQKYAAKERVAASHIAAFFGSPLVHVRGAEIGSFEDAASGIIPLRNAELILCAGQFGNIINLGILSNEVNSDKSPEFLRAMELVMNISCRAQYWTEGTTFSIKTPLGTKSKAQLVKEWAVSCDTAGWEALLQTVSCYSASDSHCGRCPSCFKRWVALRVAVGDDWSFHFQEDPKQWYPLEHWQSKGYALDRIAEIELAYGV